MRALAQPLQNHHTQARRRSQQRSQHENLLNRRHLLSIPTPLLFLPWKGCTEGGFYDTGITDNCQKIYQPAQAAEQRFKKQQQQQQQPSAAPPNNTSASEEMKRLVNEQKEYNRAVLEDDRQKRTNQLVDDMWQTLE